MKLSYRELDWKLIAATLLLSLIGILLIMSAQHYADSAYKQAYFWRQSIWLVIALLVFAAVVHTPLRLFDASAYVLLGITVVLLGLVLMVGSSRMGATRWFDLGIMSFTPSDVAKLAVLLALSRYFAYSKKPPASKRRLAISAFIVIVPVALILRQPDLGTSLVFWVILFSLWFWSGLAPVYLALILSPIASLVTASHWIPWVIYLVVLLVFLFLTRPGMIFGILAVAANLAVGTVFPFMWNRLADYQKMRLLAFLDPAQDPRGAGYQIIQSKIAIGSGGLWGKGLMEGSQARLDFLPERHTDFIFSVLGEEFGLWGTTLVLLLFGYIFYRAIRIAARCRSRFASNVVAGAAALLLFQLFINIGMTLGFMPVTGLALPFLSYGGTSLVLSWLLMGLIVSADYRWQEY